MTAPIAIAIGDPTGIGPEIALKALAAEWDRDDARYLLLGDPGLLRQTAAALNLELPLPAPNPSSHDRIQLRDSPQAEPGRYSYPSAFSPGHKEAALASLAWLEEGARECLAGRASALVTAPVSKEAIIRAGRTGFVGQTEHLAALAGAPEVVMMLLGCDDRNRWLRVALATTHVAIKNLPAALRPGLVERAIRHAAQACRDLGLPQARVAVCGLNPHAGEGGKMGSEEITIIAPAVQAARAAGCDVQGPFAADALFHRVFQGQFEAVVAMYHDQGLVPLKMIAFETGVNWSLGLPFVRTSPDHGTACDIAGRGIASPGSMISALRLAKTLAAGRPALPPKTT